MDNKQAMADNACEQSALTREAKRSSLDALQQQISELSARATTDDERAVLDAVREWKKANEDWLLCNDQAEWPRLKDKIDAAFERVTRASDALEAKP